MAEFILCSGFALGILAGPDSLLRRWALDLVHFAIAKSALSTDARTKRTWLDFSASGVLLVEAGCGWC